MKRALIFFVALVVVAGAIVGVVLSKTHTDKVTLPSREVDTFLHAWARNDTATMATLLDVPPPNLAAAAGSLLVAVPGSSATYRRTSLSGTATEATATYHAKVTLKGLGAIEWNAPIAVTHADSRWTIKWTPGLLYPALATGQHLSVKRTWPRRAPIVAADGSVLAGDQDIVTIGLEASRIKSPADLNATKAGLKTLLGVDPTKVDGLLSANKSHPDYFLPLGPPVRKDAGYEVLRAKLYPLPGVVFQTGHGVGTVDAILTQEILGNVGEITAERLTQLGSPYATGDKVGLSGLESVYEKRLAGAPRTDVVIVDGRGATVRTIKRFAGKPAQPVRLTIDLATQKAAEAALAGVTKNAALVAIDTTTGAIKAVVSKPDNGFDRALAGRYPPGSTFKVVTSAALLAGGSNGSTPAPCPAKIVVDGRPFHNFEGEASGALDLAGAFQISCNNAFIGLADKLPADALGKAAQLFGFNAKWTLGGIDVAGGSYPKPSDAADRAASAIGQGRVLASPVQMASIAAAVASGQWRAPLLITAPARATTPKVSALAPTVRSTLQSFMASVVRAPGTAAGAGLPADSFGKTGTAEFSGGTPPPTHAWYIGYRGNTAFAVIVEGGGVGGRVAAPLAAGFLLALPR
ncbi:MAG TPA: penicillin-binding transpeptidase domain-containing protein [Acidimicrobiia bacterium]|nr:penicillin-binding transpeptidase domain-containing protein [Acidimicrobiia bacterium]